MIEFLLNIDTEVFLFLNSLNSNLVDPFMKEFSGKLVWAPMYAALACVMVWRFGWRKGLILVLAAGLAVACADMVSARLIRPFFQRMRPANIDNPISLLVHIVDDYRGGSFGFPSCHAANTFALAVSTSLMLHSRQYMCFIFIWALLQCYSRIYLGVHYPGDIIVGALVGSLMGFVAYKATQRWSRLHVNVFATTWPVIIVGIVTTVGIAAYAVVTHLM